jgi:hypothetical protein
VQLSGKEKPPGGNLIPGRPADVPFPAYPAAALPRRVLSPGQHGMACWPMKGAAGLVVTVVFSSLWRWLVAGLENRSRPVGFLFPGAAGGVAVRLPVSLRGREHPVGRQCFLLSAADRWLGVHGGPSGGVLFL